MSETKCAMLAQALGYRWTGRQSTLSCPKGCYATSSKLLAWNDNWLGGTSAECQPICKAQGTVLEGKGGSADVDGAARTVLTKASPPGSTLLHVEGTEGFLVGLQVV